MEWFDETIGNLRDAGCNDGVIAAYQGICEKDLPYEVICRQQALLLGEYRKALLEQLHEDQKKIDCLDHLLYRLRNEAGMLPVKQRSVNVRHTIGGKA